MCGLISRKRLKTWNGMLHWVERMVFERRMILPCCRRYIFAMKVTDRQLKDKKPRRRRVRKSGSRESEWRRFVSEWREIMCRNRNNSKTPIKTIKTIKVKIDLVLKERRKGFWIVKEIPRLPTERRANKLCFSDLFER